MQKDLQTAPQTAKNLPAHNLILEERKKLTVSGVLKVESCDEYGAVMQTPVGRLSVTGTSLVMSELSLETGEVQVSGEISDIIYTATRESAGGFLRGLLR